MLCALTSQDMTYQGIGPRETATFEAETAQGAVANPQTPQWARHSGTPGTHNTLASGSHHSAHSSHMVQAYAAANVQACGTISGAPGAVDNRERRDLLDLEQQEEEEDVQQDEQQSRESSSSSSNNLF